MNQIADPSGIFEPIRAELESEDCPYDMIITGHSHLPGNISFPHNKRYVNTGSWTFGSSQYAVWDGKEISVKDWLRGTEYTDQAYRHLLSRRYRHMNIFRWWRENYLGWLRYRVGEKGRVVQPEQWISTKKNGEDLHERTRPALQNDLDGGTPSVPDRSAETTPSVPDSKT